MSNINSANKSLAIISIILMVLGMVMGVLFSHVERNGQRDELIETRDKLKKSIDDYNKAVEKSQELIKDLFKGLFGDDDNDNKSKSSKSTTSSDNTGTSPSSSFDYYGSDFTPERILKIPYATSNDGFVNLRSLPSNDGEILGKITSFGGGVILGTEIDYYKINSNGKTGYCYNKYINFYSWYSGYGKKRLVATKDCPLYSGYSEGKAVPLATIPAGTIIGDKFYKDHPDDYQSIIEEGDYYILNTAFDNEWKVKKSYVKIEKK